jgi:hypothetical protein
MGLTTSFSISTSPADVVSGSASNLQSGDTVCRGAVLDVTPIVSSTWATSGAIKIFSSYPPCGKSCPALPPVGATTNNAQINWLDSATYSSYYDAITSGSAPFYLAWPGAGDLTQTAYDAFAPFYDQPVSYNNGTTVTANSEGNVSVLCAGNLSVMDNGTLAGTSPMPTSAPFAVTLTSPGQNTIATSLSGMSCFGAVAVAPFSSTVDPNYFSLYLFANSNQFPLPSTTGQATTTLNVVSSSGNCSITPTAWTVTRSATANGTTLIETTIQNNADQIQVVNVTATNPDFSAMPFPTSLSSILGFSSVISSNGFNTTINSGASEDLYVLVTTTATSETTNLTFNARTLSSACGTPATCNATLDFGLNPATCSISPSSLAVLPLEVGKFAVICQDLAGAVVPCAGNNGWTSDPALNGTFLSEDNTQAQIFSQATPPVSGFVNYTSNDGTNIAYCGASLDVTTAGSIPGNTYACAFAPPSADLGTNQIQDFNLSCLENGATPQAPNSADYSLINGLIGTPVPSADGVTYTAPATSTSGDLQGVGYFGVRPNVIGAVALAPITVTNSGPSCSIQLLSSPGATSTSLGMNESGNFSVTCTDAGTPVPCVGTWAWSGIPGGFVTAATSSTQALAYPTVSSGSGNLNYTSGTAACSFPVTAIPPGYTCGLTPTNAVVATGGTQPFSIQVYDLSSGTPIPISVSSAIYDLTGGLGGTLTNSTPSGTLYTAPATATSGQLQGAAVVDPADIPVCLATITVTPNPPSGCSILPASATLGNQEAGLFTATCTDSAGAVPCVSGTWAWSGIPGGFYADETNNVQAEAYPLTSSGTGFLTYTSGLASCNSTVTAIPPPYTCTFTPLSWTTQNTSDTEYFAATVVNVTGTVPASDYTDSYDFANGLIGILTNETQRGVQYTASGANTSGQLQGLMTILADPNNDTPVCLASITVGNGGNGTSGSNNTSPGGGGGKAGMVNGQSQYCTISGNDVLYPGDIELFYLMCNKPSYGPCTAGQWINPVNATILSNANDNMSAEIAITGTSGSITAAVNGVQTDICTMTFSSSTTCADTS